MVPGSLQTKDYTRVLLQLWLAYSLSPLPKLNPVSIVDCPFANQSFMPPLKVSGAIDEAVPIRAGARLFQDP